MKKLIYSFIAFSLVIFLDSCSKNELPLFEGEFLQLPASFEGSYERINDGQTTPSGFKVNLVGAQRSAPTSYTFEVDDASTAIADFHYVVESNSGTIPANASSGDLPISINDDNINPGEVLTIVVNLTGGDVALNNNYATGSYTIQVTCEADLTTTFSYTNTDNFTGDTFTGTGTFSVFDNTPGVYVVEDFSFGSWAAAYGIDPPSGTLQFRENCGKITLSGTDNYGDTWEMTDISASNGPDFTFTYENTYGEFGTVTLTRTDGSSWPSLVLGN